jgi:hypothetical protein
MTEQVPEHAVDGDRHRSRGTIRLAQRFDTLAQRGWGRSNWVRAMALSMPGTLVLQVKTGTMG